MKKQTRGGKVGTLKGVPWIPKKPLARIPSGFWRKREGPWVGIRRVARTGAWSPPWGHQRVVFGCDVVAPASEPFTSLYVRWSNLDFQGGYRALQEPNPRGYDPFFEAQALVDAVVHGRKPAAHVPVSGNMAHHFDGAAQATGAKLATATRLRDAAIEAGLAVGPLTEKPWGDESSYFFCIAQPGTVDAVFDLDAWIAGWDAYETKMPTRAFAGELHGRELLDVLTSDVVPEQLDNIPVRGLVYGFPIASTVAIRYLVSQIRRAERR